VAAGAVGNILFAIRRAARVGLIAVATTGSTAVELDTIAFARNAVALARARGVLAVVAEGAGGTGRVAAGATGET